MPLLAPSRGLVTPQGFKPVNPVPALTDEKAEREKIFQKIGRYLDLWEIDYNDILVAKYIPEKIGSFDTSVETQREQRWQNKCGLVLKYGPTAKQDGFKHEVGDWVYYRQSDGHEIGVKCENDPRVVLALLLSPAHIIGRVTNPDLIW